MPLKLHLANPTMSGDNGLDSNQMIVVASDSLKGTG
jgi:hypothetical protein